MDRIKTIITICLLLLTLSIIFLVSLNVKKSKEGVFGKEITGNYQLLRNSPIQALSIEKTINLGSNRRLTSVYNILTSISGLALIDYQNNFIEWLPEGEPYFRDNYFPVPGEHLDWFRFDNLGGSPIGRNIYLIVQYSNTGTAGVHPFYLYSYGEKDFKLILKLVESSNKIEIRDLDGDIKEEIIHDYSLSGIGKMERDLFRWKDIWSLNGEVPSKINRQFPKEYDSLIDLYNLALTKKEWEPDVHSYYPVIECLKDKALQIKSDDQEVDAEGCRRVLDDLRKY